jgi:hypothetical protein
MTARGSPTVLTKKLVNVQGRWVCGTYICAASRSAIANCRTSDTTPTISGIGGAGAFGRPP